MNILYIHGFNSAFNSESDKVKELLKIGNVIPFTYDTFDSPSNILKFIKEKIADNDIDLLVGTSYGGYWAMLLCKHLGIPAVALNPCVEPHKVLKEFEGQCTNFVTQETRTFKLSNEKFESVSETNDFKYLLPLVGIELGDEVINAHESIDILKKHNLIVYEDGSHRFTNFSKFIKDHVIKYLYYVNTFDHINT